MLYSEMFNAILQDCRFVRPIPHFSWKVGFSYEFEKLLVYAKSFKEHEFINQCKLPCHVQSMAPVFYQFPCLDASFYYPILSPLKRVASGKSVKDLQSISFSHLQVLWTGGCAMEFPKGSWSGSKEIGGLN
ncbi:hypothetical protein RHMOL_Rhmol09G0023000 [Rhododendron molle]|uniref:Uncharacterized protein n=1 Tax=Rhododendron molle TaxID=49168 RepID=A0ACC0MA51_RHOML|nr:hypothetical protein RHMOL_Rhmol09G0023000 [Rhododendron molle]